MLIRNQRTKRRAAQSLLAMSIVLAVGGNPAPLSGATDAAARNRVAEILGKAVYDSDLVSASDAEAQKAKLSGSAYDAWLKNARGEKLRGLVWSAVFSDYAQTRGIKATKAEVASQIAETNAFLLKDRKRREQEREALIRELRSPGLDEKRRKEAKEYLETLNSLRGHDATRDRELSSPAQKKLWKETEQRVAEVWVRQWKVNQALFLEFGGRIIFQQAGWEPIDAYRKLLEEYEARKAFVVDNRELREAVYSYFNHTFVYADEKKAKFYFERPYWERTPEEMKAAGF